MTAQLCAWTGWPWDYVWRVLDWTQVAKMVEHYRDHPPVDVVARNIAIGIGTMKAPRKAMVARVTEPDELRRRPAPAPKSEADAAIEAATLLAMFPAGLIRAE